MTPRAAITSDIDTLASIYKGYGCRRPDGYTHAELRMGLETFIRFLEPYRVKATLFVVGDDLRHEINHGAIRAAAADGHEIANHTLSHAQGFRRLRVTEKEAELAGMEDLCEQVTGRRPIGFRSPGWNIGDDALPILVRRGYLYDSSVFPTSLAPLLKLAHWATAPTRARGGATTLGHLGYVTAPVQPYRTSSTSFGRPGHEGIIEFPITVTPRLRLPWSATWVLARGLSAFDRSCSRLRASGRAVQFQFHLSDFVDYSHVDLVDQAPPEGGRTYVPRALRMPLADKLATFRHVMDRLATAYTFVTLGQWAEAMAAGVEHARGVANAC